LAGHPPDFLVGNPLFVYSLRTLIHQQVLYANNYLVLILNIQESPAIADEPAPYFHERCTVYLRTASLLLRNTYSVSRAKKEDMRHR